MLSDGNNNTYSDGSVSACNNLPGRVKDPKCTGSNNGLNADYTINQDRWRILDTPNKSLPRHTQRNNILYIDGHVKTSPVLPSWRGGGDDASCGQALDVLLPYNQTMDEKANGGSGAKW